MPGEDIQSWSVTAANNGTADTSINWAEGQTRASVNNSARSQMAAHAKDRNLKNGSIVTGGTANVQTFTSGVSYIAPIPTGLVVKLKIGPSLTNTGAATLNMDGIGAVSILDQYGVALRGAELTAGTYVDFIYNGTNWIVLGTLSQAFGTGDVRLTFKIVADTGWVMMNDGSIGNAASGATTRANADTAALFTLLYDNIPLLPLQNSSGVVILRGGFGAAIDYSGNARLVLPAALGRSLAIAGAGSGLTTRTLGSTAGTETHTLTIAELAPHTHAETAANNATATQGVEPKGVADSTGASTSSLSTGSTGSGTAFSILDPTTYLNVMIKL